MFHNGRSFRCPGYNRNRLGLHFSIVEVADVQVLGETYRTQDDYNCLLGLMHCGLGYNIISSLRLHLWSCFSKERQEYHDLHLLGFRVLWFSTKTNIPP
jgi:hypothetical protein